MTNVIRTAESLSPYSSLEKSGNSIIEMILSPIGAYLYLAFVVVLCVIAFILDRKAGKI
jgi:hypothetical protein